MFYDNFLRECDRIHVSPTKALTDAGLQTSLYTHWRQNRLQGRSVLPKPETVSKLAAYFGCTEEDLTVDGYLYEAKRSWDLVPDVLKDQVRDHIRNITIGED